MLERRVFVIIKYKNNEMKISKNMKAKNKTKTHVTQNFQKAFCKTLVPLNTLDEWINKLYIIYTYICNGILPSHQKE